MTLKATHTATLSCRSVVVGTVYGCQYLSLFELCSFGGLTCIGHPTNFGSLEIHQAWNPKQSCIPLFAQPPNMVSAGCHLWRFGSVRREQKATGTPFEGAMSSRTCPICSLCRLVHFKPSLGLISCRRWGWAGGAPTDLDG